MKVKSAKGFKKTQHILEFPGAGDIMVCEGPFTGLSAWHFGFHAVVTFGSGVSEQQLALIAALARKTGKRVGVAFDEDKAGRKGYRTVKLGMYHEKIPTFRIRPETGNDLNDSWKAGKGIRRIADSKEDITIPELELPEEGLL
jgi:DNA primase